MKETGREDVHHPLPKPMHPKKKKGVVNAYIIYRATTADCNEPSSFRLPTSGVPSPCQDIPTFFALP